MPYLICLFLMLLAAGPLRAQPAKPMTSPTSIFERLTEEMKNFRIDTSNAPEDRVTRKVRELRALRGGFNINEAIDYKLEEEKAKGEKPAEEIEKMTRYFRDGPGRRQLDNAVIWIYRKEFTYAELKKLVRFYRTPTGQKLAENSPEILLKSAAAAQIIQDAFAAQK